MTTARRNAFSLGFAGFAADVRCAAHRSMSVRICSQSSRLKSSPIEGGITSASFWYESASLRSCRRVGRGSR